MCCPGQPRSSSLALLPSVHCAATCPSFSCASKSRPQQQRVLESFAATPRTYGHRCAPGSDGDFGTHASSKWLAARTTALPVRRQPQPAWQAAVPCINHNRRRRELRYASYNWLLPALRCPLASAVTGRHRTTPADRPADALCALPFSFVLVGFCPLQPWLGPHGSHAARGQQMSELCWPAVPEVCRSFTAEPPTPPRTCWRPCRCCGGRLPR